MIAAAFLAGGAQVSLALPDPAVQTGASGTTGAAQATRCPKPQLRGLPKRPMSADARIPFKLTNMTSGSAYVVKAGPHEVLGGTAGDATVKRRFRLPDQGGRDRRIAISAIVDSDQCDNAPWKLQRRIRYDAVTAPAPQPPPASAKPAPAPAPPPAAAAPAKPTAKPAPKPKSTPTPAPRKPGSKPASPFSQQLPAVGPPLAQRGWLTPNDSGAKLEQQLKEPKLGRLEQESDDANSSTALIALGIVFAVFAVSTAGGLMVFRRRDEIQFEAALGEQLKHLEEGDPGLAFSEEEPATDPIPAENAPFAEPAAPAPQAAAAATANGAPPEQPAVPAEQPAVVEPASAVHRAEVEAELQRILSDTSLDAELRGIVTEARSEAERQGVEIDPDVLLQAVCDEINGSAKLSDPARAQLRSKFEQIIAEEAERVPTP